MNVAPGSLRAWVLASRPATLLVGVVPIVVGAAAAVGDAGARARPLAAALALVGAVGIQIGTNLANDVFDFERGADTEHRKGPTRAAQAGLLTPEALRLGVAVAFGVAALAGGGLAALAGPYVLAIGIASIVSGVAYTAGPYALAYLGLGDAFAFLFFGPVAVAGTSFAMTGAFSPRAALAGVGVGAFAAAVLVVNNVRDAETDVLAHKKTLVVRLGAAFGIVEYALLFALAYAVPVALELRFGPRPALLLPLASAPFAVVLVRGLARAHAAGDGAAMNLGLAKTARLLLVYGLLLAVGLAR